MRCAPLRARGISFELRAYKMTTSMRSLSTQRQYWTWRRRPFLKTLVVQGDRSGYLFALVPAGTELDLRALAEASGNKRVELVPQRDVPA